MMSRTISMVMLHLIVLFLFFDVVAFVLRLFCAEKREWSISGSSQNLPLWCIAGRNLCRGYDLWTDKYDRGETNGLFVGDGKKKLETIRLPCLQIRTLIRFRVRIR